VTRGSFPIFDLSLFFADPRSLPLISPRGLGARLVAVRLPSRLGSRALQLQRQFGVHRTS